MSTMAQPFSFGFSNDDIENDSGEDDEMDVENQNVIAQETPPLLEPRLHGLDEMVCVVLLGSYYHRIFIYFKTSFFCITVGNLRVPSYI